MKKGTLRTVELGKLVDAQYGIYTRNREKRHITLLRTAKSTHFSDLKGRGRNTSMSRYSYSTAQWTNGKYIMMNVPRHAKSCP